MQSLFSIAAAIKLASTCRSASPKRREERREKLKSLLRPANVRRREKRKEEERPESSGAQVQFLRRAGVYPKRDGQRSGLRKRVSYTTPPAKWGVTDQQLRFRGGSVPPQGDAGEEFFGRDFVLVDQHSRRRKESESGSYSDDVNRAGKIAAFSPFLVLWRSWLVRLAL
ncbi:hypothetical protein MTO96_006966 [Rhipicephalus appendiculatus]